MTLESATYFIREDNEIVGMLCVNTDLSAVRNINAMAQQLMACFDAAPVRTEPSPIEVESLSGVHTGSHRPAIFPSCSKAAGRMSPRLTGRIASMLSATP